MNGSPSEEYDPVNNSFLHNTDLESLLDLVAKTSRNCNSSLPAGSNGGETGNPHREHNPNLGEPVGKIMGMMPENEPFMLYDGSCQDTICSIFSGSRRWDVGFTCKPIVNKTSHICAQELYGRYLQPAMFSYWMGDTGARMKMDDDGQSLTLVLGCNRIHSACDTVHIPF